MIVVPVVLILVVILPGCSTLNLGHGLNSADDLLLIEVRVDPPEIKRGDTLRILLKVTNEGSRRLEQTIYYSRSLAGFCLVDTSGTIIYPPVPLVTRYVPPPYPVFSIDPRETQRWTFNWVWDDPEIAPGTYWIYAGLGRRGLWRTGAPIMVRLKDWLVP